jgi:hypothetical protein
MLVLTVAAVVALAAVCIAELVAFAIICIRVIRRRRNAPLRRTLRYCTEHIGVFVRGPRNPDRVIAIQGCFLKDPLLTFRNAPLSHIPCFDEQGNVRGRLTIDEHGFVGNRTMSPPREYFSDDVFNIIVTGGSAVVGCQTSGNERTFASLLEVALNADDVFRRGGKRVQVINAGVAGYSSSQELIYYMFDLQYLNPHMWVMVNGGNEKWKISDACMRGATEWHHHPIAETRERRLSLMPASRHLIETIIQETRGDPTEAGYKNIRGAQRSAAERYARNIEVAAQISKASGALFVHALQPMFGWGRRECSRTEPHIRGRSRTDPHISGELLRHIDRTYFQRMSIFYEESTARLEDLSRRYRDDTSCRFWNASDVFDDTAESVYHDPRHYNDLGHWLLAKELATVITKMCRDNGRGTLASAQSIECSL